VLKPADYEPEIRKKERKKDDSDISTSMNMVLLCFQVGLSLYVILKRALQQLEGSPRLLPPFEGEHIEQAGYTDYQVLGR
jgi:hypothetical protein